MNFFMFSFASDDRGKSPAHRNRIEEEGRARQGKGEWGRRAIGGGMQGEVGEEVDER